MDKQICDVKLELNQMKNEIKELEKEEPLWTETVSKEVENRFLEIN